MNMLELEAYHYLLLLFIGIAVSFLNSLAGGGSTLSLPLFLWMGLPVNATMGTNRFGVVIGNLSSFLKLLKSKKVDFKPIIKLIPVVVLGAALGSYLVLGISEQLFRLALIGVLLLSPILSFRVGKVKRKRELPWPLKQLFFFCVGFYGGYFHAGMGFVLIAALSWVECRDLVRVNAAKSFLGTFIVLISTIWFVVQGEIEWGLAFVFAIGGFLGGWLGAKVQLSFSNHVLRYFMAIVSLLLASKLAYEFWNDFNGLGV